MKKWIVWLLMVATLCCSICACVGKSGPSFETVKEEALEIAGVLGPSGDDYFIIDTFPYENGTNKIFIDMIAPETQRKTLEAIKYVNERLGFNGSLYNRMTSTTALMGRQSEENRKYKVSWTYHPDKGLEVTYEKK